MTISVLRGSWIAVEYSRGRTLAADEGVRAVVALVMIVVLVAVVVLVVRASATRSGSGGVGPRRLPPRPRRTAQRPVAPDDDPDFLRELERRTRPPDRD